MFDIGFWELALIGVVALLVVGPDRLPGLARTVGLWVGRIRRYVSAVRDDIEREIQAEELKKMLDKPGDLNPLKEVVDETTGSIRQAKSEIEEVEKKGEDLMSDTGEDEPAKRTADPAAAALPAADDETGADAITPQTAATSVGEAATGAAEPRPAESTGVAEDTVNDERRSG